MRPVDKNMQPIPQLLIGTLVRIIGIVDVVRSEWLCEVTVKKKGFQMSVCVHGLKEKTIAGWRCISCKEIIPNNAPQPTLADYQAAAAQSLERYLVEIESHAITEVLLPFKVFDVPVTGDAYKFFHVVPWSDVSYGRKKIRRFQTLCREYRVDISPRYWPKFFEILDLERISCPDCRKVVLKLATATHGWTPKSK